MGTTQNLVDLAKKIGTNILNLFLKELGLKKNSNILEYGCGAGAFLSFWYKKKYNLNGIDYSKSLITKGKKYFPKINFRVGEISALESFHHKFDLIISHSVFQYFRNYKYANKLILKMLTKLKPNGYICILDIPDKDKEKLYKENLKKEFSFEEFKKNIKRINIFFIEKVFFEI